MDISQQISDEKKPKPSFWNRLLRIPRKSYLKEKQDDSFKRQSMVYSSLNTPKRQKEETSTSDESENFITLESSALQDVHRDAGILFLNKSSIENCFAPKEENKHVQFAPTPMNKYYRVDVKAAPSKKHEENKENVEQTKSVKPTRPILRFKKSHKSSSQSSAEDTESNKETKLLNVTYIDGPQVKTPSIPRTSTKVTLIDRKNGSMPHLNVSTIVKYNSLPRNPKLKEENAKLNHNDQLMMQSVDVKSTQSLTISQTNKNAFQKTNFEQKYRRSVRDLSTHRQSCYGVSDPSRIFEGKKILQEQNYDANRDLRRRLSLGPLHYSQNDSGYTTTSNQKSQEVRSSFKKLFNVPESSKEQSNIASIDQQVGQLKIKLAGTGGSNANASHKQNYFSSTGCIPNRAINEVGLPIALNKNGKEATTKTRSKSPQYIQLCETFTKTKNIKSSVNQITQNKNVIQRNNSEFSAEMTSKSSYLNIPSQNKRQVCENMGHGVEQPSVITESRKQAIISAMYSQKRKIINKICKYNSKQSDEGFSSMADDECSFNCSCPSCVIKFSKSYKRNGIKQLFSNNKDKYFFTIEPEVKERNELERLPENQTVEGPMARAQPHLSNKNENELEQNKTWYECNDTMCQTPCIRNSSENNKTDEFPKTPKNKMVENIYENITQIINSATKKNLTPQDVKKLLSTPISSPLKPQKKSQRTLFSDADGKMDDESLKEILSPIQTSDCFNDSIVLLQEIFQKLSQECRELLQPNSTTDISNQTSSTPVNSESPGTKYVNDLIKNLKSSELSEIDFANIIGGIAQNIFSDTKAKKRRVRTLMHSTSLPDLQNKSSFLKRAISVANSLKDLCDIQLKAQTGTKSEHNIIKENSVGVASALSGDSAMSRRHLPDGWSKTPTTENSNLSSETTPTKTCSGTDKDSSNCSEGDLQLLENAIRLGMGLAPEEKVKRVPIYAASPTKATKYKSRDVLSGKGKLKLKLYNNCGLVTVFVMKAAKLDWANNRELNAYVKITMVPDESKRVHWRTNVQKGQKNPVFNQKFSFELLAEDITKRLVFSVWHRDFAKQRSELIGCMSFSVKHVMDNAHIDPLSFFSSKRKKKKQAGQQYGSDGTEEG